MSKAKLQNPNFSVHLEDFCAMTRKVLSNYFWNQEEVNKLDKETQDHLHRLELEGLDYSERAKIATALKRCRQLRRQSKDTVAVLEPFVSFLNTDKGKNMMNLINEALGKTRKVEEQMKNRTYRYKILEAQNE